MQEISLALELYMVLHNVRINLFYFIKPTLSLLSYDFKKVMYYICACVQIFRFSFKVFGPGYKRQNRKTSTSLFADMISRYAHHFTADLPHNMLIFFIEFDTKILHQPRRWIGQIETMNFVSSKREFIFINFLTNLSRHVLSQVRDIQKFSF